jgi:predicted nucleic acid-binding protein
MTRAVCDASAIASFLVGADSDAEWVTAEIAAASIAAPELMPFEAANVIRRHAAAKLITASDATTAHAELLLLDVELWSYEVLAERAWQLRGNLTIYDASYVALAELVEAPLVTLDRRIRKVRGLRCAVLAP